MSASIYIQYMNMQPCMPVLEHGETEAGALEEFHLQFPAGSLGVAWQLLGSVANLQLSLEVTSP